MKTILAFLFRLSPVMAFASARGEVPPIPEPGIILYGRAFSSANVAQQISALSWSFRETGGKQVTLSSPGGGITLVERNGESWFIARLPFATTDVPGITFTALPDGVFRFAPAPVSYDRSVVTANGVLATIRPPQETTFQFPDGIAPTTARSRLERVDLVLSGIAPATYESWIAGFYPTVNDPRALPLEDPDHDGIVNLLEHVQGSAPNTPGSMQIQQSTVVKAGQSYFAFSFLRSNSSTEVTTIPEIAADLAGPWYSDSAHVVEESRVNEGEKTRITYRDTTPISPARKHVFLRLRATKNP